jgi:antibiotic biosynthesis monooxygenase (ABM) superfamily enzyme
MKEKFSKVNLLVKNKIYLVSIEINFGLKNVLKIIDQLDSSFVITNVLQNFKIPEKPVFLELLKT